MKVLLFFYEIFIMAPLLLLITILTTSTVIVGGFLGNASFWGYYPPKIWSKLFCMISLVKVEVKGREKIKDNESYIFVANHQGAYDIFLIYGYLNHNFKWVLKHTLRKVPMVGKACEAAKHIFVDRTNPKGIKRTIEEAKNTLKDGMSVVIFPEGTRSPDGKIKKFKRGAFQLAVDLNMPVVPMTINGSYKILSKTSFFVNPGKLTLEIHDPIIPPVEGFDMDTIVEESYQKVASALGD
ncbi:MAG: 1-acyl-sn-glycerol-3-phosphate acyltransferase [Muribaculaceae bacterium]|nr:1-acyl-sn-glycerol-3-phosphate acyltransferase [Muribaculaceae bacterium]